MASTSNRTSAPTSKSTKNVDGSVWRDEDFGSFWKFYAAAHHEWPLHSAEFLKRAGEDFCLRAYADCSSADQHALIQRSAQQQAEILRACADVQQLTTGDGEEDDEDNADYEGEAEDNEEYYGEDGGEYEDGWYDDEEEEAEMEEEMEEMHCDGEVMGDKAEMTPEMLEFVRVTQQHRKELAEKRAQEAAEAAAAKSGKSTTTKSKPEAEKSWLERITETQADDYVMADTIGVHGVQQATTFAPVQALEAADRKKRNVAMYGKEEAVRIEEAEAQMHARFERILNDSKAPLWPNIPLRFSS